MPLPHLCVHTTPCSRTSPIPFTKTSLEDGRPCPAPFLLPPQIAALPPALLIFRLSVLCKHSVRTHTSVHVVGYLLCLHERGREACWRFKHCKHFLNGCLLQCVGDVILCAANAKFRIQHMQAVKRPITHREKKTYDQKKAITHWLQHP